MIRNTLKWLAIVIVGFLTLVLIVNLDIFDEELNPEFIELVNSYKSVGVEIDDEKNGFYYLLTINKSSANDLHGLGREIVKSYEQALKREDQAVLDKWYYKYDLKPLNLQGNTDILCDFSEPGCLDRLFENAESVRNLIQANQQVLLRYKQLNRYEYYAEKMTPSDYAPIPAAPIGLHKLFLAGTALLISDEDFLTVIDRLDRDIRFWRKVLAGTSTTLTKMVAKKFLEQNYMLLAEIVYRMENMDEFPGKLVEEMFKPLEEDELSLKPVWLARTASAFYLPDLNIGNCNSPGECLLGLLYQRNATINYTYEANKRYIEIISLAAPELAGLTGEEAEKYSFTERPSIWLYNPTGKILLGPMVFGFPKVALQLYNLEGLRRLLALQLAIKESGVDRKGIDEFISSAGKSFLNPYTNEPMEWNARDGLLVFKGMENAGEIKTISVRL